MKKVIKKYRNNNLTPEELDNIREHLYSYTDEQLADSIHDDWNEFEPDLSQYNPEVEDRIFKRICPIVKPIERKHLEGILRLFVRVAAFFVISLLSFSTYHYYNTSRELASKWFNASTDKDERVALTLPDGSLVELNNNSNITYSVSDFCGDIRRISFSGEAYFDITSMPNMPFIIETNEVEVIVKGTIFNLKAREEGDEAILSLIDGNVQIISRKTAQTVDIHPNEKAVVDYITGNIEVSQVGNNENLSAWRLGRLTFVNANYTEVIMQLRKFYGDSIPTELNGDHSERFTGMIPIDNLTVALDILSTTFR